ncbi:MAG: hypothetical protein ACRCSK_01170 [Fusobacteriaceae bacterium]
MQKYIANKISENLYVVKSNDGLFIEIGETEYMFLEKIKDMIIEKEEKLNDINIEGLSFDDKKYLFEQFKFRNFLTHYSVESETVGHESDEKINWWERLFFFDTEKITNKILPLANIFTSGLFFIILFFLFSLAIIILVKNHNNIFEYMLFYKPSFYSLLFILFSCLFLILVPPIFKIITYEHYAKCDEKNSDKKISDENAEDKTGESEHGIGIYFIKMIPYILAILPNLRLINKKKHRIIINLIEPICNLFFFSLGIIIYFYFNNTYFIIFSVIAFVLALKEILFFYNSSGYFILCEIFDVHAFWFIARDYVYSIFYRMKNSEKYSVVKKIFFVLMFVTHKLKNYFYWSIIILIIFAFFPDFIKNMHLIYYLIILNLDIFINILKKIYYFYFGKPDKRLNKYFVLLSRNDEVFFKPLTSIKIKGFLNAFFHNYDAVLKTRKDIIREEKIMFERFPQDKILVLRTHTAFIKRVKKWSAQRKNMRILSINEVDCFYDISYFKILLGDTNMENSDNIRHYEVEFIVDSPE